MKITGKNLRNVTGKWLFVLVFVKLKSVVTDSEVLIKSNKIKELMEVKIDTIRIEE